jgi:hypothetical protein
MTLFVQSDAGSDGTGSVFPNQAEADLFIISNMDPALGETTLSNPPDLIEVTYTGRTQSGFPPERLDELVNTKFTQVPADPTDIIILAVDNSFVLSDGTAITSIGGTSLPPKSRNEPGSSLNPTESVLVIYDKESDGLCEFGLVSQKFDLASPTSVTLFHELSHAFRSANKQSLSLAASGCTASPEEEAAEKDENKMRAQLGVPLRDPTNHCGEPCGQTAGCCIVASIATGSQSIELNALRQLRDRFLRRSEVGFDFFERLHYDYYAFSPQVCREMARSPWLVQNVANYYVRPLKGCLELAQAHLVDGLPTAEIGERLLTEAPGDLAALSTDEITGAISVLRGDEEAPPTGRPLPATPTLASDSRYVRWALIEPIAMYLSALVDERRGLPALRIGERFVARLGSWGAELPITEVWAEFSDYELDRELRFLRGCLLVSEPARTRFAERLAKAMSNHDRLPALLARPGVPTGT